MNSAHSATRSAAMTGGALATVALGSAIQVALYLRHFGTSHRTDGFIAAFAVYSLIVVVAQILRTTAVPLLSGSPSRLGGVAFAWAMALIALATLIGGVLLASPLAHVVAGSTGAAGRAVAADSLRVMAPAAALQLLAAGLAVRGAVSDRLVAVAVAYMVSAGVGLVSFFPLRGPAAERVLAWTTLVASAVLVAGMLVGVDMPSWRRPRLRTLPGATLAVMRSIPVPASFVLMYPVALALLPRARGGDVTLFGLAFTACSYLAGFTGQGLSMVDAVALARIDPGDVAQRSAIVTRAFRYSLLAAVPGLAAATLVGGPIVHTLVSSGSSATRGSFGTELLLLAPWTVATLGLWATLPAVLAHLTARAERRLLAGVAALIAIHIAAVLAGRAIAGFNGVIVAMAVAPTVFVLVALARVAPAAAGPFARQAAVVLTMAAASYGVVDLLVRAALGSGLGSGLAAAVGGTLLYAALAAMAYRDAARTVAALITRSQPDAE